MNAIAAYCMLAHGWRRALLLLVAGVVGGFSVAPFFFLPALFLALPVWVWALDGAEFGRGWRRFFGASFSIGFWFGLGYFLVAIHWVGAAFLVDGGWLLAVMPMAILGLAAVLALFWGLASALAHLVWSHRASRIFAFAAALAAAEFARGHLFTGFPFDLLGYALTANDQMMQAASLVGVYGLTFAAPLLAATPALIWPVDKRSLTERLVPFFLAIGLITAQVGYGHFRLESTQTVARADMRLRLVQPNIAQAEKWQAESGNFVLDRLMSLSETIPAPGNPGLSSITHLIWPETALPFYLSQRPEALARIARMLPATTLLVTGMPWLDPQDATGDTAYNAILAIDNKGEIAASYFKTHLVPFGEYLPFQAFWERFNIKQFVQGAEGWAPGDQRRLMAPNDTPGFLPLVCYEAIFSGDLGEAVADAAFLLNLTNDSWFDGSIGPAQHFHHARLRAVEEGKPLVRVANAGITAFVDPLGRITALLTPGEVGVLDISPQFPLPATVFAQWRHWPLAGLLILIALWQIVLVRTARRHTIG